MKNGRKYSTKVEYPKGDLQNPHSQEEIVEKFRGLAGSVFSDTKVEEIVSRLLVSADFSRIWRRFFAIRSSSYCSHRKRSQRIW